MNCREKLRAFRLLSLGHAKALTNDLSNGMEVEEDVSRWSPA